MARRHTLTSRTEQIQDALQSGDPADALLRLYFGLSEGGVELFRKAFRRQLRAYIQTAEGAEPYPFKDALIEVSSVVLDGDVPEVRKLALSESWCGLRAKTKEAVKAALAHYRAAELCLPESWWNEACLGGLCETDGLVNLGFWGGVTQ